MIYHRILSKSITVYYTTKRTQISKYPTFHSHLSSTFQPVRNFKKVFVFYLNYSEEIPNLSEEVSLTTIGTFEKHNINVLEFLLKYSRSESANIVREGNITEIEFSTPNWLIYLRDRQKSEPGQKYNEQGATTDKISDF